MKRNNRISRREALKRLGLGAAGAYIAPSLAGLSMARAASSSSPPSPASRATPPSPASPASRPSPVSRASAPSGPSRPSGPTGPNGSGGSQPSGPSGPGKCKRSAISGDAQISRRDYQRAQRAISRGDARPLREVLSNVRAKHPGKVLHVGFSENGTRPTFNVLIVGSSGAVISVTVDAKSGRVTSMRKC